VNRPPDSESWNLGSTCPAKAGILVLQSKMGRLSPLFHHKKIPEGGDLMKHLGCSFERPISAIRQAFTKD